VASESLFSNTLDIELTKLTKAPFTCFAFLGDK